MKMIKILIAGVFILSVAAGLQAQELSVIKLSGPDMERGSSLMTALSERQSAKSADKWSDKAVSQKDLSDLLWAANGINRKDSGKKTAASAQNAQDVDIYVFMKAGVYVYDAGAHALNPVAAGDHRTEIGMMPPGGGGPRPGSASGPGQPEGQAGGPPQGQGGPPAGGMAARPTIDYPVRLLLVSENSRFGGGTAEKKFEWGCIDSGLVGQNVMLFCAANGLVTHPKAAIDDEGMKTLLGLTDTQHCHLELPVGYAK
jgi:nitroreductase